MSFESVFIEERSLYFICVLLSLGAQGDTGIGIRWEAFLIFPFHEVFPVTWILVLVSGAARKRPYEQDCSEGKGLFILHFQDHCSQLKKVSTGMEQSRLLKGGADAETMKEWCYCLDQSAFV